MEEINNFQQEPDENLYQAWERFKELLMKCAQHYLTEMQEVAIQEMAEYSQKWQDKDNFELKGQFLKELRTNTFSGLDHEDANEHIEKVLEIVDLFYVLNITIDQVMLRAFLMSLTRVASRWLRNKPTGSITT
ncbi:hypothetical protein Tco_1277078 [Tanacetum coccineum]